MSVSAPDSILNTHSDKVIAASPVVDPDRVALARSLFGVLTADMTLEEAKEDRLRQI